MELANDAAVLKGCSAEQRKEYSLSLVEVLAGCGKTAFAPCLLCMADSEKNMGRRIDMIQLGGFFKRRKWFSAIAGVLVISLTAALFLTAAASENHKVEITDSIVETIDRISQAHYQSTGGKVDFAVTASKIYAVYRQKDVVRVFAVTAFSCHKQEDGAIQETGAGAIPVSITYKELEGGHFELLAYTEAQDGDRFASSVEDFCRIPSGQKIKGLAAEMLRGYGDTAELEEIKQQKWTQYLLSYGWNGSAQTNTAVSAGAQESVLQALWKNKTAYIGDNSKVGELISTLAKWSAPQNAMSKGFSLTTGERPYGVSIQYQEDVEGSGFYRHSAHQRAFQFRALILLCLIDNADFVRYEFSYKQMPTGSLEYTREWADKTVGGSIRDFEKDFDTFKAFVNDINSEYLPLTAEFDSTPKSGGGWVKIDEPYIRAENDTAEEVIYEDAHYKYSFSAARAEKTVLEFQDKNSPLLGQRIALKEAIAKKYISIEDLILNGLQVEIAPKNLPKGSALAGGCFNYYPLGNWTLNGWQFFPSNRFMYMVTEPDSDALKAYFALGELIGFMERILGADLDFSVPADKQVMMEGLAYIHEDDLALLNLSVEIWWEVSISRAPVSFRFGDDTDQ